jgi:predicted amidohydrolase YtcJ
MSQRPDLIVTNAAVYTCDPAREWAEAFAVAGGEIIAVGGSDEISALATDQTEVLDAGGRMVMPGLSDVHTHLGAGGNQVAHEMSLLPTDTLDDILTKVRDRAAGLGPDEWIAGGIIGSPILEEVSKGGHLPALDEASGGRPVILRDDSMHNRWINSRALELIGVGADTPDPEGGIYVRDADGVLTGVLQEMGVQGGRGRHERLDREPGGTAQDGVQDRTAPGELLRHHGSSGRRHPGARPPGPGRPRRQRGDDGLGRGLHALPAVLRGGRGRRGALRGRRVLPPHTHVRPDFVKLFLDGVPMTRTSAMLTPYICHGDHEAADFKGEPYWSRDDLVKSLERCYELGLSAKLHCAGDGSVRLALDAIETVRKTHGAGPIFQIAHVVYVDPADIPRFAALDVVADASPYIWFPSVIQDSCAHHVPAETFDRTFPCKDLVDSGAVLAAGSDWPVVPLPNPWLGLGTLVTRANPDPAVPGELNGAQRLSLPQAIAAFTINPVKAMGLGDTTGAIRTGLSADFVVLDQNLFEIEPGRIHQTQVEATYFQGAQVYEKPAG